MSGYVSSTTNIKRQFKFMILSGQRIVRIEHKIVDYYGTKCFKVAAINRELVYVTYDKLFQILKRVD
jgi:hypothetical protein